MITLLAILGWLAAIGGIIMLFQIALLIFGIDSSHADFDLTSDVHDGSMDGADGHDTGVKMFSLLGISTFLLFFGLAGRYFIITLALHWSLALILALVIALIAMYIVGWVMFKARKLESDGTVRIENSMNCLGTVYLPFTGTDVGTAQINVNGIMHEFDAMAENPNEYFKVGDSIKVVDIKGTIVKVILNKNN